MIKNFRLKVWLHWLQKLILFFSSDLLNGQKKLSIKAKFFRNFRNKSRSILMLHKINKNKRCAPKLIFFNEKKIERFGWFLKLKINFENQILALFDGYFWPWPWKNQIHFCDQFNHTFNLKCFYQIPLTWWKTYTK